MKKFQDQSKKYVTSKDGTKIFYDLCIVTATKNPCLFFLHGLGGDLTAWDKIRQALRKLGYSSVAIDLRGHGLSQRPKDQKSYAIENSVKDVLLIIQKEGIKKPVIIGHCFGGMIAIALGGMHPKTPKALILINTGYTGPKLTKILSKNSLLFKILPTTPSLKHPKHADFSKFIGTGDYSPRRIYSDIRHTSMQSYLASLAHMLRFNANTLLKKISVPTLVISGTKDTIFPPAFAKAMVKKIKGAEISFIKGENHIVPLNNPNAVTQNIAEYLRKIEIQKPLL